MAKNYNVATIVTDAGYKYQINADAIVDITMKSNVVFKGVRVVGINMMGDGLRVIASDGVNEIPVRTITNIVDSNPGDFPGVVVTKKN